jgi:hypothetical protein
MNRNMESGCGKPFESFGDGRSAAYFARKALLRERHGLVR